MGKLKTERERVVIKTPKLWKVPKLNENFFCKEEIEFALSSINNLDNGSCYMMDYFHQWVITDSEDSLILCGYKKKTVDKAGFKFFDKILDKEEWLWMTKVNHAAFNIFFNNNDIDRRHLVLSYDLTVKSANGKKNILHHKVTPFRLCSNGNLWLGLCKVIRSPYRKMNHTAIITNEKKGEKYIFKNGEFVLAKIKKFSKVEKEVLVGLAQGVEEAEMSEKLGITVNQLKRIKKNIFHKLNVTKSTSALLQARIEKVI